MFFMFQGTLIENSKRTDHASRIIDYLNYLCAIIQKGTEWNDATPSKINHGNAIQTFRRLDLDPFFPFCNEAVRNLSRSSKMPKLNDF